MKLLHIMRWPVDLDDGLGGSVVEVSHKFGVGYFERVYVLVAEVLDNLDESVFIFAELNVHILSAAHGCN